MLIDKPACTCSQIRIKTARRQNSHRQMSSCPYNVFSSDHSTSPTPPSNAFASSQLSSLWSKILSDIPSTPVTPPTASEVLSSVTSSDYNEILTQPADYTTTPNKTLCSTGVICKISFEISSESHYTGLLSPGIHSHGLIRMSSALVPSSEGVMSGLVSFMLGKVSLRSSSLNSASR